MTKDETINFLVNALYEYHLNMGKSIEMTRERAINEWKIQSNLFNIINNYYDGLKKDLD